MSFNLSHNAVQKFVRHVVPCLLVMAAVVAWSLPRDPDTRHLTCQFTYKIRESYNTRHINLCMLVPQTIPGRQVVRSIVISDPEHTQLFNDGGNRYARYEITPNGRMSTLTITCEIDLTRCDLATVLANNTTPTSEEEETLKTALVEEKYLEKNAQPIVDAANGISGKDEVETLRNIMRFVTTTMTYSGYDPSADNGALWALQAKHGECTEFSRLFVALCRAKGIPARVNEGYVTVRPGPGDTNRHEWVEAYTKTYGWIPFDPLHVKSGMATVDHLENNYLCLTSRLSDPMLNGNYFFYYQGAGSTPNEQVWVRINGDFSFRYHD